MYSVIIDADFDDEDENAIVTMPVVPRIGESVVFYGDNVPKKQYRGIIVDVIYEINERDKFEGFSLVCKLIKNK